MNERTNINQKDYGGEHFRIYRFHEIDGKKYLLAQHEKKSNFALYDKQGNKVFGGEHYYIYSFEEINGKTYLKVQHEEGGNDAFYNKEGNILQKKENEKNEQ